MNVVLTRPSPSKLLLLCDKDFSPCSYEPDLNLSATLEAESEDYFIRGEVSFAIDYYVSSNSVELESDLVPPIYVT